MLAAKKANPTLRKVRANETAILSVVELKLGCSFIELSDFCFFAAEPGWLVACSKS
jgi:hypothetical protein